MRLDETRTLLVRLASKIHFAERKPAILCLASVGAWRAILILFNIFGRVMICVIMWLYFRQEFWKKPITPASDKDLKALDDAQAVIAFPIRGHVNLFSPGKDPGIVVVAYSMDPRSAGKDFGWFAALIDRLTEASEDSPGKLDRALERIVSPTFFPNERRKLPTAATDGLEIHLAGLWVDPELLPGNSLADVLVIPCLVTSGAVPVLIQVPNAALENMGIPDKESELRSSRIEDQTPPSDAPFGTHATAEIKHSENDLLDWEDPFELKPAPWIFKLAALMSVIFMCIPIVPLVLGMAAIAGTWKSSSMGWRIVAYIGTATSLIFTSIFVCARIYAVR